MGFDSVRECSFVGSTRLPKVTGRMAFANFSVFAIGGLLIGVPFVIHLMMKQRPRPQSFPALRFLTQRQSTNRRQLRLRHWLLLLMRAIAIALLAAVFARPSVDSVGLGYWLRALLMAVLASIAIAAFAFSVVQQKGNLIRAVTGALSIVLCAALLFFGWQAFTSGTNENLGDSQAPVAAVLVFDTSPRMGLWLEDERNTRLKEAQDTARELMKQLPTDSEVAVADSSNTGTFSVDLGTAVNVVNSLKVTGAEYPLSELVNRAIDLVKERDDKRKEIYVLTDLSETVWQASAFRSVQDQLSQNKDIALFVLDVGVEAPRNAQLGELRLSSDTLAPGQTLRVETELTTMNTDGQFDIELALEEQDPTRPVMVDNELLLPELISRRQTSLQAAAGSTSPIAFELRVPSGIHHGQVRIRSSDGLSVDDQRYFTVEVKPPIPVLLAIGPDANPRYVQSAISPEEMAQRGEATFDCHVVPIKQVGETQLDDYAIIALLDPTPSNDVMWQKLEGFVRAGGSLAIFLGHNAQPGRTPVEEFNKVSANLMPAKLTANWRTARDDFLFLSPQDTAHPIFSLMRQSVVTWDESPIFLHWALGMLKPGTNVIVRYTNNQPAILESVLGDGRVMVMTTPVSDNRNLTERKSWNELPTSVDPLPFFMLMNGMFPYLAGQAESTWNHQVGELVQLQTQQDSQVDSTWQLITPQGDWQNLRSKEGSLTVSSTEMPGIYRLKPGLTELAPLGFASNLPMSATNLSRLEAAQLDEILGANQYTLARGTEELNRSIGHSRVGRELFPFLMLVVVGLLAVEHLSSNRFYANAAPAPPSKELKTAA